MKALYFNPTKESKNGKEKITAHVCLSDDCKNGVCEFSVTGEIYTKAENGKWVWSGGGACHDEILKYFPDLADFVALHLSNVHGQPTYPVQNGLYFLRTEGVAKCAEYLRIDEKTASQLSKEEGYYKYQLFALGIVDKWQAEADKAIAHLEALTGEKFENPYKPEEERFTLRITEEERQTMQACIERGDYTPEAIAKREAEKEEARRKSEREAIVARYDKEAEKARLEKQLMLAVFDMFGTADNVIYYDHKRTLSFNWRSYPCGGHIWTEEEHKTFKEGAKSMLAFEGVLTELNQ